ncbi:MFS general substrate transporter [Thozetella sp. PMI_491]|nr:MFS general substrate transporter [Thozetella sp. PMI_491]
MSPTRSDEKLIRLQSWLAVLGASFALFNTVGFLNAYGVFQAYYQTHFLSERSASDIAWIGSVSIFLLYLGAGFTGPLVDKFGPSVLLWTGSTGVLIAIFMTSLCEQYWQLFLAQGVLLGAGMSLVFCTPLGVVMRHMPHRRGLAMGLTIGGASIGGVIWPIMLQQLLVKDDVSFSWTMRAIGFTSIPLLVFVCVTVVEPPSPSTPPPQIAAATTPDLSPAQSNSSKQNTPGKDDVKVVHKVDFSVLKDRTYILLCVGLAIAFLGWFTPIFYISAYAIAKGQSSSTAFYLVSALNASSFFGRVVPGHLADNYGHYNLLVVMILLSGVVGFCWTAVTTLAGLVVWTLAYGFASGAVISLQGACAGKVASHGSQGTAVGFLMGCLSLSALVGAPISGQILTHSGYAALSVWTGATLVAGAAIVGCARVSGNRSVFTAF